MSDLIFDRSHALKAIDKAKKNGPDWLYQNYPKPNGKKRKSITGFLMYEGIPYPVKPLGRLANEIAGSSMTENPITNTFRKHFEDIGFQLLENSETEAETMADRQRSLANVWQRPNQAKFRQAVFKLYGAKCIVSGCETLEVLEAAHVLPVAVGGSDKEWNGIPLRADLHRLLDAGLMSLNPKTWKLEILAKTQDYAQFQDLDLGAQIHKAGTASKLEKILLKRQNIKS